MAAALRAAGADAHYAIYAGGHNWNLWTAHLDQMLIMAAASSHRDHAPRPHAAPDPGPPRAAMQTETLAL